MLVGVERRRRPLFGLFFLVFLALALARQDADLDQFLVGTGREPHVAADRHVDVRGLAGQGDGDVGEFLLQAFEVAELPAGWPAMIDVGRLAFVADQLDEHGRRHDRDSPPRQDVVILAAHGEGDRLL